MAKGLSPHAQGAPPLAYVAAYLRWLPTWQAAEVATYYVDVALCYV